MTITDMYELYTAKTGDDADPRRLRTSQLRIALRADNLKRRLLQAQELIKAYGK